jgi:hypothetical protein
MTTTRTTLVPYTVRASALSPADQKHILTLDTAQPLNTVDTSEGSYEQALPSPGTEESGQSNQGVELIFKKVSADVNTFTLTGAADGPQTLTAQYSKVRVQSDGTNWWVTG